MSGKHPPKAPSPTHASSPIPTANPPIPQPPNAPTPKTITIQQRITELEGTLAEISRAVSLLELSEKQHERFISELETDCENVTVRVTALMEKMRGVVEEESATGAW